MTTFNNQPSSGIETRTANSDATASPVRGRPFIKGQSGNPRGRPKRDHDIAALARDYAPASIAILVDIMADERTPPATRVMAARELLDRGFGRPPQALQLKHSLTVGEEFDRFIRKLQGIDDAPPKLVVKSDASDVT